MEHKFKVWWIPQIPMKAFEYEVKSFQEGEILTDALAKYDIFQYENNVKPDYANAGGIQILHPTEGWIDVSEDDLKDTLEDMENLQAA